MTLYSNCNRLTFVLLLGLCAQFSYAQQERLDSLNRLLPHLSGTARADCLNSLSEEYRSLGSFDSAMNCALQASKESEKIQYQAGEGESYYNLGSIDYEISNFVRAESRCHQAIDIFNKIGFEKHLAKSYSLLGLTIWAQSKFDKAHDSFNQAVQFFSQANDSVGLGNTYTRMALAEGERGNYEKSLEFCLKALSFDNQSALVALGQLYADVGDYETALTYYRRVSPDKMQLYLRIGEVCFLKEEYDSSLYYYRLYIGQQTNSSKYSLSKPHALLGALYLATKNYDSALNHLRSALFEFQETNNRNWIMRSLLTLGKTYKEVGDLKSAAANANELLAASQESGARQYVRDARYLLFQK